MEEFSYLRQCLLEMLAQIDVLFCFGFWFFSEIEMVIMGFSGKRLGVIQSSLIHQYQ